MSECQTGSLRGAQPVRSKMGQPAAGQTGASAPISATLTAELLSSAPKRGDAAVAILSCADGSKRWAWQRKTVGYPVPSCVGKLCLFGGNREPSDESARGTLIRELREELPAAWIDEAVSSLAPVARFVISSSEAVMAPRPAYVFTCCVFHAFLPSCATQEDHVSEGSLELLSLDDLHRSTFCWGCAHLKPHVTLDSLLVPDRSVCAATTASSRALLRRGARRRSARYRALRRTVLCNGLLRTLISADGRPPRRGSKCLQHNAGKTYTGRDFMHARQATRLAACKCNLQRSRSLGVHRLRPH